MRNCSLLLIGLLLFLSACSTEASGAVDSFQEKMTEELGQEVFFPEFEEYPITSAAIIDHPINVDDKRLSVSYSAVKGELLDTEIIEKHENSNNSEVIYGIYEGGPQSFRVEFSEYTSTDGDGESKTRTISGNEVRYMEAASNGKEYMAAFFNVDGGSYSVEFALGDELTQEDAFNVIKTIIEGQES